jgi:GNAT superfamily N-acetyltransferase
VKETNDFRYEKRSPTQAEFKDLRANAGWRIPPDALIQDALNKTIFAVCAKTSDGKTVGMGRIVGDGGIQLFITDVIVHKEWQRRGLGTGIMTLLMEYIETHASPATFVGLFSAMGRHTFYEKFGFIVRPNENMGPGMLFFPKKTEEI